MELHSKIFFVTALVILATYSTVNGDASQVVVSLQVSDGVVKVGQKVVFTCTIKGITSDSIVNFNKLVMENADFTNIHKEQITVLTSKTGLYKTLERYSIERSTDGTSIIYRLTINGAQYEDNGGYSCVVADPETYAVVVLEVYRVPDFVRFINRNESEWINVTEGQLVPNLTCQAVRLIPLGDVTVTVGNRSVTDEFLISSTTNVMCSNVGNIAKTCPLYADFNMTAEPREFRPVYTDNNKTLTCTVKTRIFDHKEISTSVKLDVKHGPKIFCTNPLIVQLNATTALMNCTIIANPLRDHLNVTWIINQMAGNRIRVDSSSSSNEYSVEETFFKDDPTKVMTTLLIRQKTPITAKSVNVDAENPISTASGEIVIQKLSAPVGGGGSSAYQMSSFIAFLSSALLVMTSFRRH